MNQTHAYDVQLRGPSGAVVQYILRARNGTQAQGEAQEKAAQMTADRGHEWRVARVDPS